MSYRPKHQAIFETLQQDILQGHYAPGGLLPSEIALSRRWKVSRPTVSRALRDLQNLGLLERRAGSGTYVRADLRTTRPVLGMLVEGLGNTEILDPICAEITRAAQERGCNVLSGGLLDNASFSEHIQEWVKSGVRGVFFAPVERMENREAYNLEIVRKLSEAKLSVALIDRDLLEFPQRSDHDLIALDNFQAGCILADHIAELGAKRIAFIAKPDYPATTDLRLAGIREGARRAGLAAVDFLTGNPEQSEFVSRILRSSRKYDAIVCSNDLTAAQLLQSALKLGKHVPKDFRLAGFDDVRYATLLPVPLTTVRQPCRAIGVACVETLLSRLDRPSLPPRSVLLKGELVVRESTNAHPPR
jgi:GntR family transcriptional regulator, arabinose operon transcriptional repressor